MPAPVDVAGETERHAPGVSARGSGAVTAGAGGVAVGGDLAGTVIVGDNNQVNVHHMTQSGGIRARRITAHNVVDGFQAIGADDTLVARAIRLSAEIQSGGITADEIIAQNLVSGLQFITGPQTATPANLKKEVAALKASLAAALGAGDLPNDAAAQAAMAHLGAAEAELAKDQPSGWQVAGSLKQAAGILKTTADTLTAADTVGNKVIALLPWAAALWAMAKRLLAG